MPAATAVSPAVEFFTTLTWGQLATARGGFAPVGDLHWFCTHWLSAEAAFGADRPMAQTLETLHDAFAAGVGAARLPRVVALAKFGKEWRDTALPAALEIWVRAGTPRLVELSERLDGRSADAATLLRQRWHSAVATQEVVASMLGHEPDARLAIDALRDLSGLLKLGETGEPTERTLRLCNAGGGGLAETAMNSPCET